MWCIIIPFTSNSFSLTGSVECPPFDEAKTILKHKIDKNVSVNDFCNLNKAFECTIP
jgi:hypothetical protein